MEVWEIGQLGVVEKGITYLEDPSAKFPELPIVTLSVATEGDSRLKQNSLGTETRARPSRRIVDRRHIDGCLRSKEATDGPYGPVGA